MGFKVYRDVKLYAPDGLTHREKLTALVLADDANEQTRLTYKSVVDPDIMRQALIRNERDMRKVLARLQDMKVIEHAGGGFKGKVAKFRFLHMDPAGCPGPPGCQCPQAMAVQNEPPLNDGPNRTATTPGTGTQEVQKEPAMDPKGGSFWHQRRSESDLPTTPSPSTTSSSPSAAPVSHGGGGGGKQDLTQAIALVDALDYRSRQPSRTQRDSLIKYVDAALAAGWPPGALMAYLGLGNASVTSAAGVYLHRLAPGELPEPPADIAPPASHAPCGHCDDGWLPTDSGVQRCPDCNPGVAA